MGSDSAGIVFRELFYRVQPTVTLNAPGTRSQVRLTGAWAVLVIASFFLLVIVFIARYVMARRNARKSRREKEVAESALKTLFAAMEDAVAVISREGVYLRVPATRAQVRHRPTEGIVGRRVSDVFSREVAEHVLMLNQRTIETQRAETTELEVPVGEEVLWFSVTVSPLDANSALWVSRDITEQKRVQDSIIEREEEYRLLFERNPCAMWVWDFETTAIVKVNESAISQYGYSRDEFTSMKLRDLRASADVAALENALRNLTYTELSVDLARHRKKDGTTIDVEVRGQPMNVGGRRSRLVVITDITDKLRAEMHARETSQMLQSVVDAAPQAVVVTDGHWSVTRWNRAAEALFGWTAEEVVGQSVPGIPDDQREHFEQQHVLAASNAGAQISEMQYLHKNGTRRSVLIAIAALKDANHQPVGFVTMFTDLTERLLLDEQQRQSQKMEAIGRLAGGIAHDFNNILTVISSYAGILLANAQDERTRNDIGEIAIATERASALTRQLLSFSRRDVVALRVLNLNDTVHGMESMLQRLINADIEFVSRMRDGLGLVKADSVQIEQIVMNLVINASDAMPDGGTLILATENAELDTTYTHVHSEVIPGSYVMLSVADSGAGMDALTMSRAFEPFFTTKDLGRGTGLGLATVYAIVKQLGGHVWIYSETGQGTTFKVYLPRVDAEVLPERTNVPLNSSSTDRTGTVLLVEDDDAVRRVVRRMLEKMGYAVVEASNGALALNAVSQDGVVPDFVITDLMMPVMNGRELANELARTHPTLRVLFTSGYTDDVVIRRRLMEAGQSFLQKPFTAEQLLRAIAELGAA